MIGFLLIGRGICQRVDSGRTVESLTFLSWKKSHHYESIPIWHLHKLLKVLVVKTSAAF
jgi:hypothetical protein